MVGSLQFISKSRAVDLRQDVERLWLVLTIRVGNVALSKLFNIVVDPRLTLLHLPALLIAVCGSAQIHTMEELPVSSEVRSSREHCHCFKKLVLLSIVIESSP